MGGDMSKATLQATEIKKRDPLLGHRAWAFVYEHQRKNQLARQEYLDAVREQPDSAEAHYWLGSSYLTDRNYKEASEEFESSVKLDPTYMPSWFQIGRLAALTGANLERGEDALRKYLSYTPKEDDPPIYRAHYWLGSIFERQGKKAEARQSYSVSLRLNPTQHDVAEALRRVS
jgi:Tfp pilus assembly protein PilF